MTRGRWARWGRGMLKTAYAIGIVGLVVAGCAGLFVLAREVGPLTRGWFEVRQVTIEGLDHVSRREVLSRLGFKDNTTLYALNPNWLTERLKQHPWIKDATVTLVPFHEVQVRLTERVPAAVVRTPAENFVTDDEGHVLAKLGTKDDPALPMLSGVEGRSLLQGKTETRQAVKTGIELARLIVRAVGGRPEIHVGHLSNLVASIQGSTFQFSASSMDQQWSRFLKMRSALRTAEVDGEGERGQEIDLRYMDRVIVRGRG